MVLEVLHFLSPPIYLYKDLDKHVLRNFSRFRLRAHHLRVESCNWHGGSSICDKCECGEVQDEKHVLFFCKCAEMCELCMRYKDLFEGMFKTLRALLLRALNLFLSWLVIIVSLILRSMHSRIKTHTDSSSLCQI